MSDQPQPMYVPPMQSICERINNPPKLIQCIQLLNEEEFAELVLESIYDEVDEIFVIVGAVANHPDSTKDGQPLDKTLDIVKNFKYNRDGDNKVKLITIKRHWASLEEMKQTFIDLASPGDVLVINDADEFYSPRDIRRVRKAIDLHPHITEFIPTFIHYYRDFKHAYIPGAEWPPQNQRIFKVSQGMKYHSHPVVCDAAGRDTYYSPEYWRRRVTINGFFIHHYGYCRADMDEVMQKKQAYYKKELKKHDNADIKFDAKVDEFVSQSEPASHILEVPDDWHPAIIREKHPRFDEVSEVYAGKEFRDIADHELYGDKPIPLIYNCMKNYSWPMLDPFYNTLEM